MLAKTFLFFCIIFIFLLIQMFMTWLLFWSWIGLLTLRNFSRYLFDVCTYFSFGKSDGILFSNLFIVWLIVFAEMVEQLPDLMFWFFFSALSSKNTPGTDCMWGAASPQGRIWTMETMLWGATMLPIQDSGSHTVTCWSLGWDLYPIWRVQLCKFSALL